jgi:Fe2+ transport system protein FeoA
VTEEKADLLRYFASLGLLPDTEVSVESVAPFGGPLLVRVAGAQYALGREVAGKIMVRR